MARFRKKPVEVEAIQYKQVGIPGDELSDFLHGATYYTTTEGLVIRTLEGDHLTRPGDWIIRGVAGEFYPCKPDIFELIYEPID